MLLPSDVARLVLGYLQQERLFASCQAFILESPDLKEYAEHSTEDGTIPACMFSLFGKSLTMILNEYVAIKAKESSQEIQVPAMMTSLWKKLDFTLNQIRSMQTSSGYTISQRSRTRNGITEMRRQRAQHSTQPQQISGLLAISPQPGLQTPTPLVAMEAVLGHSTPVSLSVQQTRPNLHCMTQPPRQEQNRPVINISRDSSIQVVATDRRVNPAPLSPGRRKCDSPRRRGIVSEKRPAAPAPSAALRITQTPSNTPPEQESDPHQEPLTENFPQLAIENAREKILSDICLQEKLAENINKYFGSDTNIPPSSKQPTSSTLVQDQSIDEILGLQGEIHMTDVAIQDILEKTESDPAFQALFDLFDYGKNRNSEAEPEDQANPNPSSLASNLDEDNAETCESSCETGEGTSCEDSTTSGAESAARTSKTRNGLEPRSKKNSRKNAHPLSTVSRESKAPSTSGAASESFLAARPSSSRLGAAYNRNTDSSLSVSDQVAKEYLPPVLAASCDNSNNSSIQSTADKEVSSSLIAADEVEMEIDQQWIAVEGTQDATNQPSTSVTESTGKRSALLPTWHETQSGGGLHDPSTEQRKESVDSTQKSLENSPGPAAQSTTGSQTAGNTEQLSKADSERPGDEQRPTGGDRHSSPDISLSTKEPAEEERDLPSTDSNSAMESEDTASRSQCNDGERATVSSSESVASVAATTPARAEWTPNLSASVIPGVEPSNIVSLKIIISDEQEDQPSDGELSHAVSSITGERIPTIILSSPAKSPAKGAAPAISSDETVLAVSSLQRAESNPAVQHNLLVAKCGEPASGAPHSITEQSVQLLASGPADVAQETGFIQLLPASTSYGTTSNYFILTDQAAVSKTMTQSNVMGIPGNPAVGQVTTRPQVLATPPRARPVFTMGRTLSQNYSPGSTILISSPVQPMLQSMMIPVSVVGQNSATTFTVAPNRVLQLPVGPAMQTATKVPLQAKSKPQLAPKGSIDFGKSVSARNYSGSDSSTNTAVAQKQRPRQVQMSGGSGQQMPRPQRIPSVAAPVIVSQVSSSSPQSNRSHRRVLCFDSDSIAEHDSMPVISSSSSSRDSRTASQTQATKAIPSLSTVTSSVVESRKDPSALSNTTGKLDQAEPQASSENSAPKGKAEKSEHADETKAPLPHQHLNQNIKSPASDKASRRDSDPKSKRESSGTKDESKHRETKKDADERKKSQTSDKTEETAVPGSKGGSNQRSRSSTSDHKDKTKASGASKDADQSGIRSEPSESRAAKGKEVRAERRSSLQELLNITANKENELEKDLGRPKGQESSSSRQPATSPQSEQPLVSSSSVVQPTPDPTPKGKGLSMTSPLTKQAAEMLQDIQGQAPASPPTKKLSVGWSELPLPRTPGSSRHTEDPSDCLRTPVRWRHCREGESTPRHLPPPATLDLPTCSPASEAGSENSINMAAHTLMILSRAAIASTGTPLKDSAQQPGSKSAGKKRKQAEEQTRPAAKKDPQRSVSPSRKKKAKKQKKLLDSFPDGMDVDKFLSSLNYDE
ncbi:protein NPAT-like isoform X1 [Acipenser oxyrinchus oxyrinchus]|uniref:Protein NPAT-like isoform X1 n=1 Tax=Acipenser oxyrinchus oxyrinchus TaxID=40147 RepID=A0AAD8DEI7_ACIOX|nr:protein NPAT-like isoform X1 [Acipenser oxyrinchus oxyrinchus]